MLNKMRLAVHSLSVGYSDSFYTAEPLGLDEVALLLLLSLAIYSFLFDTLSAVELIAAGIGFLTMLLPPVLLNRLPNYKTNMSNPIAHVWNIFNTLIMAFAILGSGFILSRKIYDLFFEYRNHPNFTRRIVTGIVVLILLFSLVLVSLRRLRNSETDIPSASISSEMLSSSIMYGDNKTVVWRRIHKTLSLFYYSGVSRAPVREPTWRLNYKIGSGAYGTVFLENVQTPDMKSPELWAIKRIPRAFPNFTFKRYQAEIENLEALARVSFS